MNCDTAKHKLWQWLVDSYAGAHSPIDNLANVWESSVLKVDYDSAEGTMHAADQAVKEMADTSLNIYNYRKEKLDTIIRYFIRTSGGDDDNVNVANVNINTMLNKALVPIRCIIIGFLIGKTYNGMKKLIEYKLTYLPFYVSRLRRSKSPTLESWWMETITENKNGTKQELHVNGIKIEPHSVQSAGKDFRKEIEDKLESANVQGLPYIVISKSNFMTEHNSSNSTDNNNNTKKDTKKRTQNKEKNWGKSFFNSWQEWVLDLEICNLNNTRIELDNRIKTEPADIDEPWLDLRMVEKRRKAAKGRCRYRLRMIDIKLSRLKRRRNNLCPLTPCNVIIPLSQGGVKIFDLLYQESVLNGNIDGSFQVDLIFIDSLGQD